MKNRKDKIKDFIENIEQEEGLSIPQFCHNLKNPDKVYYGGPWFTKEEMVEAIDSLLFGKWFSSGHKVAEFEKQFAIKLNQKSALMVNSGSSANLVAITALKKHYGWKDGDEVLVSVVGFPTTVNPILQNNLVPKFVDIELDTLNFDLNQLKALITNKTKAIFVSPVLGNPPDIDFILKLCQENNLVPILDCCDSLGSKWKGKHLNEYFEVSTYSFYPAHHITTGEGGMVTSNNEEIIKLARSFAWWGRDCYCVGVQNLTQCGTCNKRFDRWIPELETIIDHKYLFTNIGYNLKPLDMQGAIGLVQLSKLDKIHSLRVSIKNQISNILLNLPNIKQCSQLKDSEVSWFGVPIICSNKLDKENLVKYLEGNGIQTRNYFAGNLLYQPAYRHLGNPKDYPIANIVLDQVLFIGCSPTISSDKIAIIEQVVQDYAKCIRG